MNAKITAADVQSVVAEAAGHWSKARKVESDLEGVTYLSISFPVFFGRDLIQSRVEVYVDAEEWGAAAVIIGGVCNLIEPTSEMIEAFRAAGCDPINISR